MYELIYLTSSGDVDMKLILKPVAAAVALALASVSAHAALTAPTQTLTSPPNPNGLYLAVYDANGLNSEIVNLSYDQSVITAASGALTPNSATSPFVSTTAPVGTGNVFQLNFGQISGFTGSGALFNSANAATTNYMVLDGISGGEGQEEFQATAAATPGTKNSAVNGAIINIQSEIADWKGAAPTSGDLTDTSGAAIYAVKTGPLNGGTIITGQNFAGSLGTALGFYDVTTTSAYKAVITPYANSTGAGYWFLSTSGDLTWNVPTSVTSAVPLPAAVWLLGSGLLGMAGIARRRRGSA
jgi:hypothetical protein